MTAAVKEKINTCIIRQRAHTQWIFFLLSVGVLWNDVVNGCGVAINSLRTAWDHWS